MKYPRQFSKIDFYHAKTPKRYCCAMPISSPLAEMKKNSMNETRQIALERIHTLFERAKKKIREEPELAQRYAQIARRIAMKTRVKLPLEYRRLICRHCKSFIYPNVNCRVRTQHHREPHTVITCLECGKHTRIMLKPKGKVKTTP